MIVRDDRRRRGRPIDADGDATRGRCLEAATRVFAASGYAGTGLRAIADDAGITAPALYNYFPSKAELYSTAWAGALDQIYRGYGEAVVRRRSLVGEVEAMLDRSAEILRTRPQIAQLALRATVDAHHPELAGALAMPAAVSDFYDALVARAAARGEIRRADGDTVTSFLVVLVWGIYSVAAFDPAALDQVVGAAKWAARGRLGP